MFLAKKYCKECSKKRGFLDRIFFTDDELCDDCYYEFVSVIREKGQYEALSKKEKFKK
jgi:hypothetical protein